MPLVNIAAHYKRAGHRFYPAAPGKHGAFGELELGDSFVRVHAPAEIDEIIAELAALRAEMTAEPERVPDPVGLCGHQVAPGAWSQGYNVCRDCTTERFPELLDAYDRASAGASEPVAAAS